MRGGEVVGALGGPGARPRGGGIPLRQLAVPGTALVLLAALAWVSTVRQARGMGTAAGTMGMDLPAFLAMWTSMMAAMMFPSIAPVAIAWARSITARSTRWTRCRRITSLVTGYLLAWAGYGVIAFGALTGAARLTHAHPAQAKWLGAAIFVAAGVYQLTPLKDVCLNHCRSPLGQLLHYGNYRGKLRDLRVGIHHGAYCVGCCWAMMLILVAVGVMNIAMMAAIAAVIFLEKLWRHGPKLGKALGVGVLALGMLIPSHPGIAPALHESPADPPMHMPM